MNVQISNKAKKLLSNRKFARKILINIIVSEHQLNNQEAIFVNLNEKKIKLTQINPQ